MKPNGRILSCGLLLEGGTAGTLPAPPTPAGTSGVEGSAANRRGSASSQDPVALADALVAPGSLRPCAAAVQLDGRSGVRRCADATAASAPAATAAEAACFVISSRLSGVSSCEDGVVELRR